MAIGVTFIIVAVLVVAIWLIIEAKRMKHKVFAILLIMLIIFTYFSFSVILKNNEVDLKTAEGLMSAGKLYFSWLGGVFTNVKSITAYAFKQDWKKVNESVVNEVKDKTEKKDNLWNRLF